MYHHEKASKIGYLNILSPITHHPYKPLAGTQKVYPKWGHQKSKTKKKRWE